MKCELQIKKLKDLCIDGKGKYGIPASAVPFDESLYTYLRITDITDDGRLNKSGLVSVDDAKAQQYILQPNDIVFARTGGSTGRNYFYDGSDGELVYAGFLIKFSIDPQMVNPRYIKYYCQSQLYKDWVNSFNTGSTRGNINAQTFANMEIPVPQRDQQDLLVQMLSVLDHKIDLNNKINANLQQQAQAIFKSWFVDFEPFQDGEFVESELGTIPVEFTITRTGGLPLIVTDYVANGSFASLKANVHLYQERNYAYFIRNTDLKSGEFKVFVDEHSYNFLSKSRLQGGEIIISNVGDVGSVFLCPVLDGPMTLGNNIIMLKPERQELQYYLYIWFKWSLGQSLMQGIKSGSAQPKFNKTDFKSLPIVLPPDKILQEFHEVVSPIFKLVEKNQLENRKIAMLRDVLLPKLMNGEIEINGI